MTQEEMYKQETGREPYQIIDDGVYGKFLKREYSPHYITWLEKKATLADAEKARREAAEEVLSCVPYRNNGIGEHNAYLPGMDEAVKEHRDIITAYDKAVNKTQGGKA